MDIVIRTPNFGVEKEEEAILSSEHLPVDLKLDDDTRLEKIQFADSRYEQLLHLNALQQCVLMARFCLKRRAVPAADERRWSDI